MPALPGRLPRFTGPGAGAAPTSPLGATRPTGELPSGPDTCGCRGRAATRSAAESPRRPPRGGVHRYGRWSLPTAAPIAGPGAGVPRESGARPPPLRFPAGGPGAVRSAVPDRRCRSSSRGDVLRLGAVPTGSPFHACSARRAAVAGPLALPPWRCRGSFDAAGSWVRERRVTVPLLVAASRSDPGRMAACSRCVSEG
jgi:hypothetical protein